MGRMSSHSRPVLVLLAAGLAKRYGGCKPLAPLGLQGEAVIDLTAGDAVAAGFGEIVLVLGPATGPAIEYHVRRQWPITVRTQVAYQPAPLGTAHAVLCARTAVGDRPFAVVNGDDVYGAGALRLLADHLRAGSAGSNEHVLVTFGLADSVVGTAPVTRGTVQADGEGHLTSIEERRLVSRQPDGTFGVGDGRQPDVLDPTTPVSVNLWGFRPGIWAALAAAVAAVHPDADTDGSNPAPARDPASIGGVTAAAPQADPANPHAGGTQGDSPEDTNGSDRHPGSPAPSTEVLLPEVVATLVSNNSTGTPHRVTVIPGPGRCVGVTHATDLPLVRSTLATMVARGQRAPSPWVVPA